MRHKGPSPSLPDAGQGLGMLLLRAREVVMSEYRPIFRANNLTEQQWRILRFLAKGPALDAATLSERCMILAPSLTRIMRDLEARGLLKREARSVGPSRLAVAIARDGSKLVEEMAPLIAEKLNRAQSKLSVAERDQLTMLLNKLAGRDE